MTVTTPQRRQMKLATFIHNGGAHPAGWRHPAGGAPDLHDFKTYHRLATKAEAGKFHCYFSGDSQGYVPIVGKEAFSHSDNAGKLEPTTLLSALAVTTSHIGLIGTVSTTQNEPYSVARRFASLDHISHGRAGWNVVTSGTRNEAENFGAASLMAHDDRYGRAEEFVDVVRGLWDSWQEGALLRDQKTGQYFDPAKVRALNHRGERFSVKGPLNVGRPPQGHPIIVQAGGSEPGRALAARTADMIFTAQSSLAKAKLFYDDMKARAVAFGRDPAGLLVIPSVQLLVRSTEAEALQAQEALLDLVPHSLSVSKLQTLLDADLSGYDLDGPLPDISLTNGGQWVQQQIVAMASDEHLTIRQLARRTVVSRASFSMAGTPEQIADMCEQWFLEGGADGFSLAPNYIPAGLDEFVDAVVPILQARGLFHTDYEAETLRENLGLPRPANSFVVNPDLGCEPDIW
ncbi:MAG: LLM class flavin-dependent oxidoreductase [Caulobacteraceae bacterium]